MQIVRGLGPKRLGTKAYNQTQTYSKTSLIEVFGVLALSVDCYQRPFFRPISDKQRHFTLPYQLLVALLIERFK
jgi:hypothetical protein